MGVVSKLKILFQNFLQKRGRYIARYPLQHYLTRLQIDCVLDVGANSGQTGRELRQNGFEGQICSFEPQQAVYDELKKNSANDSKWSTFPYGLGDCESQSSLNVSGMGPSSSFLALSPNAVEALPALKYVGSELAKIQRLDQVFEDVCGKFERVFLKVDTQGYERKVVLGSTGILDRIVGMQLELSLVPQYAQESTIEEMIAWVRSLGFVPYWFVHGYNNPATLQLYQVDVIFIRQSAVPPR